jgi:hypothetical protein
MFIPAFPHRYESGVEGRLPNIWYGLTTRDGDAAPWKDVSIGSIYIANVSGTITLWVKDANAGHDDDWATITVST